MEMGNNPQDFRDVQYVQFLISSDRERIWVNIDGICVLRVKGAKSVIVTDESRKIKFGE